MTAHQEFLDLLRSTLAEREESHAEIRQGLAGLGSSSPVEDRINYLMQINSHLLEMAGRDLELFVAVARVLNSED